ncbi:MULTISPECIES: chemotaxis protein CheD [unclassified Sedimentibacter]|uniref:chemotaxis protein CheD n=1 Tax=unclassified Sedimentibacter TaxID=2649220 RepID=UPI0027DF78C8|nr:chemotaxis protein CheD [Sedimentibacter sp. MB35-C1]WMJ78621.1 chemotaxis protein CheD [Sedimentibacter sp. MB35-C1]
MSQEVSVGISDMKIVTSPKGLISYALGSCVGICIIDKAAQLAGMAHIMLPYKNNSNETNKFKYADTGITEMVTQMEQLGAKRARMIAKIAGGAKMFDIKSNSSLGSIGERNIGASKETLRVLNIRLFAEDVGKNYGRTIIFDSTTGYLTIKSFGKNLKVI